MTDSVRLKARTKLISFRVSEEEFWNFKQICSDSEFVSFSDLARTAIQELIENRSGHGTAAIRNALEELTEHIDELARSVSKNSSKPDPQISGN
jgi:hypothetical protein